MKLQKIALYQYKNYLNQQFLFDAPIIAICGLNGTGKTNILDAIYYLCFAKSYFTTSDSHLVTNQLQGLRIEGKFQKHNEHPTVAIILRENNKKEILWDNESYKKLSDHIGKLSCVMIAPDDIQLINDGSEVRRKAMDAILSQTNSTYLHKLIQYNKLIAQRNSLLKQMQMGAEAQTELLAVLNDQLVNPAEYIHQHRTIFLKDFLHQIVLFYEELSEGKDAIKCVYQSQLDHQPFANLLKTYFQRDVSLQRTNAGIHRDDILFELNEKPFKQFASQGQKKSLLFAFKLAEFEWLKKSFTTTPILLLDDVFEKLDAQRMHLLLEKVCINNEGQVFITDTHKERLTEALKALNVEFQLLELNR